ncbi:MAG: HAMP domain-containing histidine kinase [Lachnospiraceae bacterium]|nr:HAMP domain-containing histidine kinase [Lachnospiraceae bacterium]
MLKRMRRRVILAAMLAFSAVILLIGALVNLVNFGVVTASADRTLDAILVFEERSPVDPDAPKPPPMQPFRGLPDMEANFMTRFFTVRFDDKGEVIFASTDNIASIGEEEAVNFATSVLKSGKKHGYLKAYRYLVADLDRTTAVIFLNTAREQQEMRNLLILTVAISAVSLLIVFILVMIFSSRAIRPIANNIKQQKQFITDASHELKTPLTSISTSLDVLAMERGEDEWTENIRQQTARMTKMVGELVTLSRLDEENPLPDPERFSVTDVAWEIHNVYETMAKANEKHLSADIEDGLFMVGDRSAVLQMLSVLLDNAIRYSDPGGEIRLGAYKKRGKIHLEVFNTCDLSEIPDVTRLFDRFYRPDHARSSNTGGTGIGLSIAKAVADSHGGTISASCPSGKTMTIKIIF